MPKSDDITRLIDAIVAGGGSRAESFFVAQGLGLAYASAGKYDGIRKHVNRALMQAEREARQDDVVQLGLAAYGLEPSKPTTRQARKAAAMPQTSDTSRVFISHATADKEIAEALADLIRLGTGLSHERILCTSLEGMGIPVGTTDYLEYLRVQMSDAGLVLPVLSPAFFDSEVCLIEIGAMWGLQMPAFPLLVPPVDYARVEKLLGKFQGAKIDESSGLSQLHDQIVQTFELKASTAMWEAKKAVFEKRLPKLLKNLATGTRVSADDLKVARRRAAKLKARVTALEAKVEELKEQNLALYEATTEAEADAAIAPKKEIERFQAAVESAADAVSSLSRGVCMALYESFGRDEIYYPEQYSNEATEAERGAREDLLYFDQDEGGYLPNFQDPTMSEAQDALIALFQENWSHDLEEWFLKTYRKRLSGRSLPVWEALGLI